MVPKRRGERWWWRCGDGVVNFDIICFGAKGLK